MTDPIASFCKALASKRPLEKSQKSRQQEKSIMSKSQNKIKAVSNFCRHYPTVGVKIEDLYIKFIASSMRSDITMEDFENSLEHLNKKVIKDVELKIALFLKGRNMASLDSLYYKFIKEHEYVSRAFWDEHTEKEADKTEIVQSQDKILKPSALKIEQNEWASMPDVFKKEAIIKAAKYKDVDALKRYWSYEDDITLKNFCVTKIQAIESTNKMQAIIKKPAEKHKTDSEDAKSTYGGMLPVDWPTWSIGKRVDFVKVIQHKEFRDYVLSLDKKLEKFFLNIKEKPKSTHVYVTIYSFNSETTSQDAKLHLKGFVDALNQMGRARLQYIECSNLNTVEIREVK